MAKPTKREARNANTATIKDAIEAMMRAYRIKGKFDQSKLIASWENLMGRPIASRTEKLFVKDKTLFVKLNSAPLRQELTMAKEKVLDIIRQDFDAQLITDIKFY
jgi:predicted nucleic acid-binding Zn ribbon protein